MKNQANRSRLVWTALLVTMVLVNTVSVASAQAFMENFESYEVGSDILSQGDWKGYNGQTDSGARVSDAFAHSGRNSIELVPGSDLIHEHEIRGGKWILSMRQYVPSDNTGYTFLALLNRYAERDTALTDLSIQTMFSLAGGIAIFNWRSDVSFSVVVFDRWIELKYVIDLDRNTVDIFYDGILFETAVWDEDGSKTLGALNLANSDGLLVYYDDIKIERYLDALGKASSPRPADDASDVLTDAALEWTPGAFAAGHDVYLGTDYDAVSSADRDHPLGVLVSQNQASPRFEPEGSLEYDQTYYLSLIHI